MASYKLLLFLALVAFVAISVEAASTERRNGAAANGGKAAAKGDKAKDGTGKGGERKPVKGVQQTNLQKAKQKSIIHKSVDELVRCDRKKLLGLEECCDTPKLLSLLTANWCQDQLKMKQGLSEKDKAACLVECIMANQTLVNEKGEFNWEATKTEFLEVRHTSNIWKPYVDAAIDLCRARVEKWGRVAKPGKCNPNPSLVISCMGRELTKNCPDAYRKDLNNGGASSKCTEQFQHLKECSAFAKSME